MKGSITQNLLSPMLHRRASKSLLLALTFPLKHNAPYFQTPLHRSLSTFSSLVHSNILSHSSNAQSLSQVKQAHAFAIVHGFLPQSIALSGSLMLRYAAQGDVASCRFLFECTVPFCCKAFLWNTLIRAYSIAGVNDNFNTYNKMIMAGVRPDDHTFPFVFKACADVLEVKKGMETHGFVFKLGFDRDVFVGNTLLQFYGNCGILDDAEKVFAEMHEKDVVSWNTMIGVFSINGCYIEVVGLFHEMNLRSELKPNLVSVVSVLPVCAAIGIEAMASQVHCYVMKFGFSMQVTVGNALVDAYAKCGNVKASKQVFTEMVTKNEVSWNAIITGLTYMEYYRDAFNMFRMMVDERMKPNTITLSTILPLLVGLGYLDKGKEIHGFTLRMGFNYDVFVANSLMDMYAKGGYSTKASNVFYQMDTRNIVSWNTMIANCAQNRLESAAIELVREMQAQGQIPNTITFTNVLPACSRVGYLHVGKEIHARTIHMGSSFDLFISNALTDMYAKCGQLNLAKKLFDVSLRDEISYNILIVGYSQTIDCLKALELFSEMVFLGMNYDIVSFVGGISACANLASMKQGKEIHGLLIRRHLHHHLFAANSLLDFYTKCGRIDTANLIFDQIPDKDAASWNTMILGYGMLGDQESAIEFFEKMKDNDVEYDSVSYIAALSACSHAGLVEKGRQYFEEMKARKIEPTKMHYACMVDLLGRAGLLEEAVDLIKGLPIAPDSNIWGALLGACKIHGNVELACLAAEQLFKLKPNHSGYYILLSNMYAEAGRWDEANRIRELMKSRGVKKNPGCSWVRIGDEVHAFEAGERIEKLHQDPWFVDSY